MRYIKTFELYEPELAVNDIPGDAPADRQLHVFDFDDTLAVTKNANGVMLYRDGEPAHKTEQEVLQWLSKYGIRPEDLIPGPDGKEIQFFDNLGGCAAYVDSAKLAALTKSPDFKDRGDGKSRRVSADKKQTPTVPGEALYIDFTPSGYVDQETTVPIRNVIDKMIDVEDKGADTMVMTARPGTGSGKNFKGDEVEITNARDIEAFLKKNDADPANNPVDVVMGVTGGEKGKHIMTKLKQYSPDDYPEEIHFYDDADQNTDSVKKYVAGKTPAEVHIYGPGHFSHGEADPNKPDLSIVGRKGTTINREEGEVRRKRFGKDAERRMATLKGKVV